MGNDDVITIFLDLNAKAFQKGTRSVKNAVDSLNRTTKMFANRAISSFKKLIPLVAGVGTAFGVLSKSVSTYMSQHQELGNKLYAVWTALGNLVGPIIEKIVDLIATATSYFIAFMNVLGITSKKASELSKTTGEIAKTLAGFDELNVLQESKGGELEDKDLPGLLESLAEFLKNKMWDDAADIIIQRFNEIIKTFAEQAEHFGQVASDYFQGALHVIARSLDEVDWHTLGTGIAGFFNGLLREIEDIPLGEDIGKILVSGFTIAFKIVTGFLEKIDMKRLGEIFTGIVTGAIEAIIKAINEADFKKIGEQISLFFSSIDWEKIKNDIIELFKTVWNAAIDFLWGLIAGEPDKEPPTIGALRRLGESISGFVSVIIDILGTVWEDLKNYAKDIINSERVAKAINWLADAIDSLGGFCERHKDVIVKLIEGVGAAIVSYKLVDNLIKVASAIFGLLGPAGLVVSAIALLILWFINLYETNDEFREKVNKTWTKVKKAVVGAVDGIVDKFEKFKAKVKDLKERFKEHEELGKIWEGIKLVIGIAIAGIITAFSDLRDWIGKLKDKFGDLKEKAGKKWDELKAKLSVGNLKQTLADGFEGIKTKVVSIIDKLKEDASKSWDSFKEKLHLNGLEESLTSSFENIKKKITDIVAKLKKDINDDVENMKKSWTDFKEKVTDVANEIATKTFTKLKNGADEIKDKFIELKEKVVEKWDAFKESIGKAAEKFQEAKQKYNDLVNALKEKTTEIRNTIKEKWDDIKEKVSVTAETCYEKMKGAWDSIKEKVSNVSESIMSKANEMKNNVVDKFKLLKEDVIEKVETIRTKVTSKWAEIKDDVSGYAETLRSNVTQKISDMKSTTVRRLQELGDGIADKFRELKSGFEGVVSKAHDLGDSFIKNINNGIVDWWNTGKLKQNIDSIKETITENVLPKATSMYAKAKEVMINVNNGIVEWWNEGKLKQNLINIRDGIKGNLLPAVEGCYDRGKSLLANINNGIVDWWNNGSIRTNLATIRDSIKNNLTPSLETLASTGRSIIVSLNNGIVDWWNNGNIRTNLATIRGAIQTNLVPAWETVKGWGKDVIKSFNNGIVGEYNAGTLVGNLKIIAQRIKDFIGFSEPDEGPLSDFHTYGPDMMKLYAESILKSSGVVLDAVGEVADGITERLEDAGTGGLESGMKAIAQLQNASNWKMPDVAGGGFTPYQIAANTISDVKQTEQNISDCVSELSSVIGDLKYSLENMQWVAQFGSVRAFVRECQKVEKQMGRELGV